MRCRRARLVLLDRRLGLSSPEREVALGRHLERCAACSTESSEERTLAQDLALLRDVRGAELDVTSRVMREVRALDESRRREVRAFPAFAASLGAAALLALAIAAGLGAAVIFLPETIRQVRRLAAPFGSLEPVAVSLASGLTTIAHALGGMALHLLAAGSHVLGALSGVGHALTLVSILLMTGIATFVIGRDLRRLPSAARRERPS